MSLPGDERKGEHQFLVASNRKILEEWVLGVWYPVLNSILFPIGQANIPELTWDSFQQSQLAPLKPSEM
jgi:hypothetical protein